MNIEVTSWNENDKLILIQTCADSNIEIGIFICSFIEIIGGSTTVFFSLDITVPYIGQLKE